MTEKTQLVLLASRYPAETRKQLDSFVPSIGYKILPTSLGRFSSGEHFCEFYPGQKDHFQDNKAEITDSQIHVIMNMGSDMDACLAKLMTISETAKEYGAQSVHAILAFSPYARQDRRFDKRMTSVTAKYLPKRLKSAGIDRVTTIDMHSQASEGFYIDSFSKENVQFLSAVPLIHEAVKNLFPNSENIVYGAPDGGDKPDDLAQCRAHQIAQLDRSGSNKMFFITKCHKGVNTTEVTEFRGNVQDCLAVELDDMTDTGGTLINGAFALKVQGASQVIAAVTHGIFSGDSLHKLTSDKINNQPNPIDRLVVSDSLVSNHTKAARLPGDNRKKIMVVSTLPLIKQALTPR